jgi:NADP-dependent 3-hydroxy acid dehydrogenase YdfG
MRERRSGRIVNLSSMGGRMTLPGGGWYHASKHAVEALSDALRFEVGPFGVQHLLVDEHPAPPCARFDGIERDNCLYGRVTPG